jgi:predicted O-linked N-acetylglucosamine transferase (SPINDLY family)
MTTANLYELALEQHRAGHLTDAEAFYRQVLAQDPNHAASAFLLGGIALVSGDLPVAAELLRHATTLEPANGAFHANLAEAYRRLRRHEESLESFELALSLRPDLAEPFFNLGLLLQEMGELDAAIICFERSAETKPDSTVIAHRLEQARATYLKAGPRNLADGRDVSEALSIRAWLTLAAVHRSLGHNDKAEVFCRRALDLGPQSVRALMRLADILAAEGRTDEASLHLRQLLKVEPGNLEALARLMEALQRSCRLAEFVEFVRDLLRIARVPSLHSVLVQTLPYLPSYDDAAILREARVWERQYALPVKGDLEPVNHDRSPDRRLRIGYVSPYFREHVNKTFLEPLFANRDRQSFELFCYSDVKQPDEETAHIRLLFDEWRDIVSLSDEQVAKLIRQDRIDILVDLQMHAVENRLLVFARKPAPIQICWLAYAGTTGLSAMDYRVTDWFLDPAEADTTVYAEQLLRLPDSFWCYVPRSDGPEVNPLPALTVGEVRFGSLNNVTKVNDTVVEIWARVLLETERSKLTLFAPTGDVRRNTLTSFARRGVDSNRIEFLEHQPRHEYLATYNRIDVCLDTFPYNGGATSLDAFWMGVPVVTLVGKTVMGRAGLSLAMNLGLNELVASTPDEFVRVAVNLVNDLPRLSALRAGLRKRMQESPLMDGPKFAANMERSYRGVWQRWCER